MRHILLVALGAVALLVPGVHAKEQQDLRERVRDGVQRTDKDLETLIHRDKLNAQQLERFDAATKDLRELRDAVANGRWEGERDRLERAVENLDFVVKNASIEESARQTLGIDVYTLGVILDSWKK
jgi:hypothetical protein